MNAFASLDTVATHWRAPWPWVHRGTGSPVGKRDSEACFAQ